MRFWTERSSLRSIFCTCARLPLHHHSLFHQIFPLTRARSFLLHTGDTVARQFNFVPFTHVLHFFQLRLITVLCGRKWRPKWCTEERSTILWSDLRMGIFASYCRFMAPLSSILLEFTLFILLSLVREGFSVCIIVHHDRANRLSRLPPRNKPFHYIPCF